MSNDDRRVPSFVIRTSSFSSGRRGPSCQHALGKRREAVRQGFGLWKSSPCSVAGPKCGQKNGSYDLLPSRLRPGFAAPVRFMMIDTLNFPAEHGTWCEYPNCPEDFRPFANYLRARLIRSGFARLQCGRRCLLVKSQESRVESQKKRCQSGATGSASADRQMRLRLVVTGGLLRALFTLASAETGCGGTGWDHATMTDPSRGGSRVQTD
jgi:hypothetical protein